MASDAPLFGGNNPLHWQGAKWDGHRSIRLASGEGLATVAYSYCLSHAEMWEAAERLALLWDLHAGQTTAEIRDLVAQKRR